MKHVKPIIVVIVVVAIVAAVALVTRLRRPASTTKHYEVAVLIPGGVNFFDIQKRGIVRAGQDHDLKIIFANAGWDSNKQLQQVENFIAKGVDLIALCAVDNLALQAAAPLCRNADIPLITFTNAIGTHHQGVFEGVIAHVGRDEVEAGRILGQMVESLFNDHPVQIALIQGASGTAPQRFRLRGFMEIVNEHPGWKIVMTEYVAGWTSEGAWEVTEAFLNTGKHIDVIVTQSGSMGAAASLALRENRVSDIRIVSLEFSKEVADAIRRGNMNLTTYFSIEKEGYRAIETASKILQGQTVPRFIEIKQQWVNPKNVEEFKPEM